MRQSCALASRLQLVNHPLPARAARQLRLALDMLPRGEVANPAEAGSQSPRPSENALDAAGLLEVVDVVLPPRLAWPERPVRARMADGSPAPRRPDFYDWIVLKRRRAQLAARHAVGE